MLGTAIGRLELRRCIPASSNRAYHSAIFLLESIVENGSDLTSRTFSGRSQRIPLQAVRVLLESTESSVR